MGWWSATIMGGDSPLDFQGALESKLGIEPNYSETKTPESHKKKLYEAIENHEEMIDSILNKWGCGEPEEDFYKNEKSIGFQVLAVLMMECGAEIKPELKTKMLFWIEKDEWANEDTERLGYIDNLQDMVRAYEGEPVKVKNEGLFEVFAKKLGGNNG